MSSAAHFDEFNLKLIWMNIFVGDVYSCILKMLVYMHVDCYAGLTVCMFQVNAIVICRIM